jgi:hypothetical protein
MLNTTDLLNNKDFFIKGQDLHVPVKSNGQNIGTAVITNAIDLDEDDRTGITEIIHLVLEPAMHSWYLSMRQENLQAINPDNIAIQNLKVFNELGKNNNKSAIAPEYSFHLDLSPELNTHYKVIHLQGSSQKSIKKTALLVHELTARWAFVPFSDIKNQLHSVTDISRLGSMTIHIEDVELLNKSEQELLLQFINQKKGPEDPLIITSSKLNASELYSHHEINKLFVDKMVSNCFEVDRAPITSHELRKVLELFFFSENEIIDA